MVLINSAKECPPSCQACQFPHHDAHSRLRHAHLPIKKKLPIRNTASHHESPFQPEIPFPRIRSTSSSHKGMPFPHQGHPLPLPRIYPSPTFPPFSPTGIPFPPIRNTLPPIRNAPFLPITNTLSPSSQIPLPPHHKYPLPSSRIPLPVLRNTPSPVPSRSS